METSKILLEYLRDMFYRSDQAVLDIESLPDEFKELGEALVYLNKNIQEFNKLAASLANGDLDYSNIPPARNELAAPMKSLHATLRHLTWQTQQVAQGDYNQKVNFMGDYAAAFNSMVQQLSDRRSALIAEIERNKQKVEEIRQSNRLLATIARNIPNWIIVFDKETRQPLFSNHTIRQIIHDAARDEVLKTWISNQIEANLNTSEVITTEFALSESKINQIFTVQIQPIHWSDKQAIAFLFTDVTQQRMEIHDLSTKAFYDVLTGLPNRRYAMALIEEWLAKKFHFCLCFIDLDNLKYVNDTFCHNQGDFYLKDVAQALQKEFENAVLCRIGGDEFMMMLPDAHEEDLNQKLFELRNELMNDSSHSYVQSYSYGIVEVRPYNTQNSSELLKEADEKMYDFKRKYKSYHVYHKIQNH